MCQLSGSSAGVYFNAEGYRLESGLKSSWNLGGIRLEIGLNQAGVFTILVRRIRLLSIFALVWTSLARKRSKSVQN